MGNVTGQGSASFFSSAGAQTPGSRRPDESGWRYLERSSEPEAVAIRTKWDDWLGRMPAGPARDELIRRLQARDDTQVSAALSELVTFVLLDSAYRVVELQPAGGTTSQTDFAVPLPVRTHFEVNRVTAPAGERSDAQRRRTITEELRKITSPDFWLAVNADVGATQPSMRRVRTQAQSWLATLDWTLERQRLDADHQARQARASTNPPLSLTATPAQRAAYLARHQPYTPPSKTWSGPGWSVQIDAVPRPVGQRGTGSPVIGLSITGAAHLETPAALLASVKAKVRQHSGLTDPLVVVLDVSSPMPDPDDVAAMLFGPAQAAAAGPTGTSITRDTSKGLWAGQVPPKPAALLILRGVTPGMENASAELWLPPGTPSPLLPGPWTTRSLGPDGQPTAPAAAATPIQQVLTPENPARWLTRLAHAVWQLASQPAKRLTAALVRAVPGTGRGRPPHSRRSTPGRGRPGRRA